MAGPMKQYFWKQKIHRSMARDAERWKIFVDGDQWLCPYCSTAAFKLQTPESLEKQIFDHLSNDCGDWKDGKGEVMLGAALKERADILTIRQRLKGNASWRLYDFENRWYCPYCSQPTHVSRPFGDKPTDEMVSQVEGHLKSCPVAKSMNAQETPLEELRKTVQENNRMRGLVVTIRNHLESGNGLWQQYDQNRYWVCPFCIHVVEDVRFEDSTLVLSAAPPLMAQHLISDCGDFKKSPKLSRNLEDFTVMVEEIRTGKRARSAVDELQQNLATARAQIKTTSSELDRAKEVQRSILPAEGPQIPGVEVASTYEPAAQLGGDFYAYIPVNEEHVGFLMADVSGHGADAALVMSMTKKAFDLRGPGNVSPGHVSKIINHDVYSDLHGKHFVTAFYAILHKKDKRLKFSRAGHNYPLLYNTTREPNIAVLKSKGSALGVGPSEVFDKTMEERELQLERGDLLLIYTDGLVEAKNASGDDFDLPRVCELIKQFDGKPLEEMLEAILKAVTEFSGGGEQEDDIALMAIRYNGEE